MDTFWLSLLAGAIVMFVFVLLLVLMVRPFLRLWTRHFLKIVMTDRYAENVWEMVTALTRVHPRIVIENSLRAESGGVIERPFGSPRKFLNFDGLVFSPAQLAVLPSPEYEQVDTRVIIGPRAQHPLQLDIPLLLGGMGYGVGISKKAKMAMAMGTAAAGTACNTGEGGFLQEERDLAKYLIVQYHSGKWAKEPETLKQADAIEIHLGQGASAAAASRIPPEYMTGEARSVLGLQPGETALLPTRHPQLQKPEDLVRMVADLRTQTAGVPIGVKLSPGHALEQDLAWALRAKVDYIVIDGGQAGTKGAPPILEDDFGLPTIYALSRAVRFLEKRQMKDKVSLLVSGGFFEPGTCLKALALGADAVCLGTAAVWAMTHLQVNKALPFEPPTHLIYYSGKLKDEFDENTAAQALANFFQSFVEEMKVATLALGKTKISDVNRNDLVALDELTSRVTGVPAAYSAQKNGSGREEPQ